MYTTPQTASYTLSLDHTISRLMQSENIDGIAFFGSRTTDNINPTSDYDLLILLKQQQVEVFQMLTYIDGRMADIVISDCATVDRVLGLTDPVLLRTREGMLIHKLWDGEIVYDPSHKLRRIREYLTTRSSLQDWLQYPTDSEKYAVWFWQNHGLSHVKRMVRSDDPIYLSAADLMLMNGLADVCRSYFIARDLLWQGEKAALRYLQELDSTFVAQLQTCIATADRELKVTLFEKLVREALEPIGPLWVPGVTSIYLRDPAKQPEKVSETLEFWEGLLCSDG